MPQLDFVHINASYHEKKSVTEVLHDVSFSVPNGKICSLLGPSGSGKTTLLKIAAGTKDYEGDFRIDGYEMREVNPAERNLSWVSQEYILYPHLTIYDNIAYPLKAMRASRKETDEKVIKIAEELGIDFLLTRKPAQLSGGQQQKVALARALVKNPSYVLLDEPLSNLDQISHEEIRAFVRDTLSSRTITSIFVTHNQADAIYMGDMIVKLSKDGRLLSQEVNAEREDG